MVTSVNDEAKFSTEGNVEIELKDLSKFSIPSPSFWRRKSSQRSETEDVESGVRMSPFKFPPPPLLANPLGEEQVSFIKATNLKAKLILFIVSMAFLAQIGFGVINVTIFFHYQSYLNSSKEFAVLGELETRIQVSLGALDELKFLLENLTSSTKSPLTKTTSGRRVPSWGGRPKFAWNP